MSEERVKAKAAGQGVIIWCTAYQDFSFANFFLQKNPINVGPPR